MSLSPSELARYDRHILLPEVGLEGQETLKAARVLLVGAGGLGSPVALYLAAAGVGRLGVVDFDRVEVSNLQRQVLHGSRDAGRAKVESARDRLQDLNPFVQVDVFDTPLKAHNALSIFQDYDLVVDGTDNFPTRYLVNDACVLLGKPNVYGSIFRFEGQVSLFYPAQGTPCYRCLYREAPPAGLVPSCAEGGVLGVLPGVVGCLQATEALKFLLGLGSSLAGRLLLFDALAMEFREIKLRRSPLCPACGDSPSLRQLVDDPGVCRASGEDEITPAQFRQDWEKGARPFLLDVREPYEWDIVNLASYGARLIPLGQLAGRLKEIPRDGDIVVYCKAGVRGARAQQQLRQAGFSRVGNLSGGILGWIEQVDPSLTRY